MINCVSRASNTQLKQICLSAPQYFTQESPKSNLLFKTPWHGKTSMITTIEAQRQSKIEPQKKTVQNGSNPTGLGAIQSSSQQPAARTT